MVGSLFFPLQFSEEETVYIGEKVRQVNENLGREKEAQIQTLTLALNQSSDRLNRLTDAYIDRVIEKDLFEARKTALLMERKELEEQLAELKDEACSTPDRLAEFFELAGSVYVSYKMAFPEEKRDLLKGSSIERAEELPSRANGPDSVWRLSITAKNVPFQLFTKSGALIFLVFLSWIRGAFWAVFSRSARDLIESAQFSVFSITFIRS